MFTNASPSAVRARLKRVMRAVKCKSKMILIALSIGLVGPTTTVSGAEPSLQQQLETVQRQLEQQQRTMEEMQRQLEKQKTTNEQRLHEDQQIRQQAMEAESVAQQAEAEVRSAPADKLDGYPLKVQWFFSVHTPQRQRSRR